MPRSSSPGRLDTHSCGSERRVHIHLGDGRGEGDARRLTLAPVRCRAPVVNWSSSAPLGVTWRLDTYACGSEPRVNSYEDGRGDIDTRRRGRERRRARRRRARTSHRSGCPRALPCPETQPVVLSTNIVVRGRSQASSRPHSSWGRARGGRRSAPGSSPSALPCPGSQLVVLSTARRHLDVLTPMHARAARAQSCERE
jgi:hypothetical protein